ncbi:LysR substrate-binding domain-containing protein [Actinomadura oligospora]|uniref:LysR substrate-binding domain-containing protein n=1 Tax=Actinomadura oligospora TaxID=111804 RepID=UPI0004B5A07B|nr:LysR substrate-binding domain-containing protein [Actinomadura oligospora]
MSRSPPTLIPMATAQIGQVGDSEWQEQGRAHDGLDGRQAQRVHGTARGEPSDESDVPGPDDRGGEHQRVSEPWCAQPGAGGEQTDGDVSVAAFHSAASVFFPLLLRELAGPGRPRPALADEDVPQDRFPALTRNYDLVLAHRLDPGPPWPRTVTSTTLLHEPLDVALPADHPLASKPLLTPQDVADQPWITVHDGFPLMSTIEAIASVANRRLDIVHRINEFAVVAVAVAAGGGVALMPRWTARPHRPKGRPHGPHRTAPCRRTNPRPKPLKAAGPLAVCIHSVGVRSADGPPDALVAALA